MNMATDNPEILDMEVQIPSDNKNYDFLKIEHIYIEDGVLTLDY